eukprot:138945-Hanusia_phi.AAC.2
MPEIHIGPYPPRKAKAVTRIGPRPGLDSADSLSVSLGRGLGGRPTVNFGTFGTLYGSFQGRFADTVVRARTAAELSVTGRAALAAPCHGGMQQTVPI